MNTIGFVETLWRDLKYGVRLLRLNPGFAVVAILSLSLGVGANTAIFQLLDAVRLRTLPVSRPNELAEIRIAETPNGRTGSFRGRRPALTNPLWEQIRDKQQGFSGIFAWGTNNFDLSNGGELRLARGLWVSGAFFTTLDVRAEAGLVDREGDGAARDDLAVHLPADASAALHGARCGELHRVQARRVSGGHGRVHAPAQLRDAALAAARDRGRGAPHRVREPRQPAAGARHGARPRDRRPPGHRRLARAHRPAARGREPRPLGRRRRDRRCAGAEPQPVSRRVPERGRESGVPRP